MATKYRSLPEDVFIYRGETQTFYLTPDKDITRCVQMSRQSALGLVGSDIVNENPWPGQINTPVGPIIDEAGRPLRFGTYCRNTLTARQRVESKIKAGEPLTVATKYPLTAYLDLERKRGIKSIATYGRPPEYSGGFERLMWENEGYDIGFDLMQSLDTVKANDMYVIDDFITPVELMTVEKSISNEKWL